MQLTVKRADDVSGSLQVIIELLSSIKRLINEDLSEAIGHILRNHSSFRKSEQNFNGGVEALPNEICKCCSIAFYNVLFSTRQSCKRAL